MRKIKENLKMIEKRMADRRMRIAMSDIAVTDLHDILTIENENFTNPWSFYMFYIDIFVHTDTCYKIAKIDGETVGYGGFYFVMNEAHVCNIAVRKTHRREGIGERILCTLIEEARKTGADRMTLEVRVSNAPAIGMYEKHGFKAEGICKKYYSDNNEDALIMRKHDL